MTKFKSKYTDCLEEALEVAEMAAKQDPKSKKEWDEVYKSCRHELYKTKGKIVPAKKNRGVE